MTISFGIKTTQVNTSYQELVDVWRDADAIEAFESAWVWDHLVPMRGDVTAPALEAWTLLSALAAVTQRLKLGVIVSSNRIRPPAVLAKMAATVDQISGGRLIFGIGAGYARSADPGLTAIAEREYGAYGIDVVGVREAIDALGEALTITRRLWTARTPFDFEGAHYRLVGAICEPKPVAEVPILIGAEARGDPCVWSRSTRTSGTARPAATSIPTCTRAGSWTSTARRSAATRPRSPGRFSSWCQAIPRRRRRSGSRSGSWPTPAPPRSSSHRYRPGRTGSRPAWPRTSSRRSRRFAPA